MITWTNVFTLYFEFSSFFFPIIGWRRSHRPSLYDISIIDEQEEREDPDMQKDELTVENTNSNANIPVYTVAKVM